MVVPLVSSAFFLSKWLFAIVVTSTSLSYKEKQLRSTCLMTLLFDAGNVNENEKQIVLILYLFLN